MLTLRIFVSSPGDVGEERRLAGRVIERLQFEWGGRVKLEPVFWEHEPLRASASFQEEIPLPSQADVVLSILWSRLGTRLPSKITRDDGSTYASGTEFEFEDALRGFERKGTPDLLVYRKTSQPVTALDSEAEVLDRLEQKKALDVFVSRWFEDAEGSLTAAFHTFAGPAVFEDLLEEHLRRLIEQKVAAAHLAPGQEKPLWMKGSPFRGLESFAYEHAAVFCGRTAEVGEMLDALRRQAAAGRPFLLVLGMSGCGKSSLVRAGLLPELTYPNVIEGIGLWRRAEFVPGRAAGDLARGLAEALLAEDALEELRQSGTSAQELGALLRERPDAAVPLVRSGLSRAAQATLAAEGLAQEPVARLALVVDQMEELFTVERITPEERKIFDAALSALVSSGLVWTLATLRSDFYGQCTELAEVMALKEGAGQYDLRPPDARAIGQVIRQPARIAGLGFEEDPATGERLDDLLRDAAASDPSALPLLEFTLEELYRRRRDDGLLTLSAYRELGGVEGALAHRAEEVFQGLSPQAQSALPKILPALVASGLAEEGGDDLTITRRRASRAVLEAVPGARELIDSFVAERLLTSDVAADGTPVVSVAHEALLRCWPRVRDQLEELTAVLRTCAQLKAAAALWRQGGEDDGYLLPEGRLLDDASALVDRGTAPLDEAELRLVQASRQAVADRRQGQKRRRRILGAAAAAVLLVVLVLLDLYVWCHEGYYASFTKQFGQPQGIGRLSSSEVGKRQWSIKLIRRGRLGPVMRMEVVNGRRHLTPYHPVGQYLKSYQEDLEQIAGRECAWALRYDSPGRLAKERAENCFGRIVWEVDYLSADPGEEGKMVGTFIDEDGRPSPQAVSGAARVVVFHDSQGREIGSRYEGATGEPRPNSEGVFGVRLEDFTAQNLPQTIVNLGSDGKLAPSADGCGRAKLKYDVKGQQTEFRCLDADNRLTRTRYGYAQTEMTYDDPGNPVALTLLNEDGNPISEISRIELVHDELGRLTEQRFFKADEKPATAAEGNFGLSREFDARGLVIAETFLDREENPMIGRSRFATRKFIFAQESGLLLTVEYLGPDRQLMRNWQGKARHQREYDPEGRLIVERYENEGKKLTLTKEGFARANRYYDTDGRLKEIAFFDTQNQPVCTKEGYARLQIEYDRQGNKVKETLLDDTGEPVPGRRGYAGVRRIFGASGEVLGERFLDREGELTVREEGYARWTAEYDDYGNMVLEERYSDDGRVLQQTRRAYDERGFQVEESYFNGAGEPLALNGVTRIRWRKNAQDRPLEINFFGADKKPLRGTRYKYDFFGNTTSETYLDGDRNETANAMGIGAVIWLYDEKQRPVELMFQDTFHDPMIHPQLGYALQRLEYDDQGNADREIFLGERRNVLWQTKQTFDELGRPKEVAFLDARRQPRLHESGCSSGKFQYDHLGNPTEMECLTAAGLRAGGTNRFFRIRIRRNGCGQALEAALYDRDDALLQRMAVPTDFNPMDPTSWQRTKPLERGAPTPQIQRPSPAPPTPTATPPRRSTSPPPAAQHAAPPPTAATAGAPAPPPPATASIPAGGDVDQVTAELERLSKLAHEQFDDYLDDPEGEEERFHDLLERFEEEAEELRSTFRKASGQGIGRRLGLRKKLSERQAAEELKGHLSRLQGMSRSIEASSARGSMGSAASESWRRVLGNLERLEALLR